MENENIYAQDDVVEQEDYTSQEQETTDSDDSDEELVTIPKSKLNSIRRKAIAFDAKKEKPQKPITNNRADADRWERMELKVDGYNNQEVDFVMKNGGRAALEDGFVKSAIQSMRDQTAAEQATLGDEGSKSSGQNRINPADFAKLPASEQQKILSELK